MRRCNRRASNPSSRCGLQYTGGEAVIGTEEPLKGGGRGMGATQGEEHLALGSYLRCLPLVVNALCLQ